MKTKILLTVLLGFSSFFLQAQIDKGKVQIGGDLSVTNVHYSENTGGNSYTDFSIHPAIGRFYSVNKMAGLFLNFYDYKANSDRTYMYGGGIYFRQYKQVVKALFVFAEEEAGFNYNHYHSTNTSSPTTENNYSISANLRPGIAYDLTKKMQLEMAYNNLLNATYSYSKNAQVFSFGSNLEGSAFQNLLVGFRFYLK